MNSFAWPFTRGALNILDSLPYRPSLLAAEQTTWGGMQTDSVCKRGPNAAPVITHCLKLTRSHDKPAGDRKPCMLSRVWFCVTPWTIAHQAPLSMDFTGQEYWSGLPCPSPGALPNPGIEPRSSALQADSLSSESPEGPTGAKRPAEMTENGELLGSFFTHQEKNKTEFLTPHQGAKTCPWFN